MNINLINIPEKPGVYMWLGRNGDILYIGKAKNLKKRMSQYFKGMLNSYKTSKLVTKIKDYNYIITHNEKEALILERNLIHKHKPFYNILLTDDKKYPYIKIQFYQTLDIKIVYRVSLQNKNCFYFGPFPFGFGIRKLKNLIQRLTTYEKGLPVKDKSKEYWEQKFKYIKKLLSSKNSSLIKELETKILIFANNLQYELSLNIQKVIETLKNYNQNKQSVEIKNITNIDVIAFIEFNGYLFVSMLFYRGGILLSKKENILKIVINKEDLIRQFISQYYKIHMMPELIISNQKIETDINVIIPKKGEKKYILNIAVANAKDNMTINIEKYKNKENQREQAIKNLQSLLGIKVLKRIIFIDNSSINNNYPVSAIISYVNGYKSKHEYRKFKLQKTNRLADVEYMKQGLTRYFSKNTLSIDLIIVDGGKAQINEAKKIIPKTIEIVGLVKDKQHKTKNLLDRNGQIIPIKDKNLWLFLNKMQLEVDRFAKSYHIKRRKSSSFEGILTSVNGIGPKIEQKLLNHFKTYAAIYNSKLDDLKKIVSEKIAIKIKEIF